MKFIKYILVVIIAFGYSQSNAQSDDVNDSAEKFRRILYYLENMYVDSVDVAELTETAIDKMLEELDPHSVYFSAEELEIANEPLNGSFDGIGVQFNIFKDTILVVSPISGGPSEKLGIRAGDKIVEIEGENVAGNGVTNADVMKKLKGPKGTKVNVGIKRSGYSEIIPFEITRDKIPIFSIDASFMVNDRIGYVKISRFARKTSEELVEAIIELENEGMEELILDLQGNGGGYLKTAINICDEFLSDDKLIVYTEGLNYPKKETNGYREGLFEKGNLIVLIDEGSASASEILSGAIQDWDRGVIVGRRSFGKGLVQKQEMLPDGSGVRITTQKYYTPAGRCIQKSYEDGLEAYQLEKYERYSSGELFNQDSIIFPDSLKYETLVKGRTVYGGGGIMPDIFVGLDTSRSSTYFTSLIRKGITNSFALDYVEQNREELLSKYSDIDIYIDQFSIDKNLMDQLISQATEDEIEFNQDDFNTSKSAIEIRVKALIARNLFDNSAFYEIINELNPSYMKAVDILENGEYKELGIAHKKYSK